jgi:hypothetical protein
MRAEMMDALCDDPFYKPGEFRKLMERQYANDPIGDFPERVVAEYEQRHGEPIGYTNVSQLRKNSNRR